MTTVEAARPGTNGRPSVSTCQRILIDTGLPCGLALPAKGEDGFHPARKYCEAHQPLTSPSRAKKKLETGDEQRPASVTNNFEVKLPSARANKLSGDAAVVEEAAAQMLAFIPMVMALTGDDVCPPAIQAAIPGIAQQLGLLVKYHPGLKKFFAPGEGTGEAMAWVGLILVTSPVMITVLAHHHVLPQSVVEKLATIMAVGAAVGEAAKVAEPDAVAETPGAQGDDAGA